MEMFGRHQDINEVYDGQYVADSWAMTTGENTQQFLLHDNGPDADELIVIFATEAHVEQLAASDTWCMNGTFGAALRHPRSRRWYIPAFDLRTSPKEDSDYLRVFVPCIA